MSAVEGVTRALVSAPLPIIIEQLGISIARAQAALDENSVAMAQAMAASKVDVGGEEYNLISLGFQPTFYAFTEATVESKLSFSMMESTEFGVSVGVSAGGGFGPVMFAASVDVSYSRKFSVSSEGTSSIAARLVALPPPEQFLQILKDNLADT
ncbi:MAG: hypothetical protein AAGF71_01390 [Pseudomonadota bacterium]